MKKYILFICFLFIGNLLSAQSLTINGNIIISEASSEGSRFIISKNGKKLEEQVINKKGRFDLKLTLGADYQLSFEKTGYITKIVSVNTEVPEEVVESNPNFPPVKLIINLLPTVQEVDLSLFNQPIAILTYNQEVDDFTFDKEYDAKIKPRLAQTEQAIRHAIATRGAAALEQEQQLANLVAKGQHAFERKDWQGAINPWTHALSLRPDNEELKHKIALAQKEAELEKAQQIVELQNLQAYKLLVSSADSLFGLKKYTTAKEKYTAAIQLNNKDNYPLSRIRQIEVILANLARQAAESQKQLAATEAAYKKIVTEADLAFMQQEYEKSISLYQDAAKLKPTETYPPKKITQAEQELLTLQKQLAAETEKKRQEEERKNSLRSKYTQLITEADAAFRNENYGLAKLRYTDADNLNLEEEYPRKQLLEINNIINSSKYKAKLAEYNQYKNLAEKSMQQKNYAGAKVYYQKALSILSVDQEEINQQIVNINRMIETVRLAEIEKVYKENIGKADQAFQQKAYAVARFYYKKALEIKVIDKYASERLQEVEKRIGERQSKEAEF